MNSASNHQPVLMPVAQRGAQDDCQKFTVGAASGNAASNGGGNAAASSAKSTAKTTKTKRSARPTSNVKVRDAAEAITTPNAAGNGSKF
jgi:hypothetical protein